MLKRFEREVPVQRLEAAEIGSAQSRYRKDLRSGRRNADQSDSQKTGADHAQSDPKTLAGNAARR
jgi:hypothetical protein